MASIHRRQPWQSRDLNETPEDRFIAWSQLNRRDAMRVLAAQGLVAAGLAGLPSELAAGIQADPKNGKEPGSEFFPAKRNEQFKLGRPITDEKAAAAYNNFYEFSTGKRVAALVKDWQIGDWKLEVAGMVEKPATFSMDDLGRKFPYEERLYRHRCVETWSMAVPWAGFPLHKLMEQVKPLASARFVKFVSFDHTKVKSARRGTRAEPFPYTEGMTISEAANELTMIVTGIYGKPLPKQHGAPVRLVIPWKYGFKSAKSLVRIEFLATRPPTFWNSYAPQEYSFEANVDPTISHPRWPQTMEWDIGNKARRPTLPFNGYGEWVASLYG